MKKELKSLGKQTVIYGAGSMLSRLSAFLLLPVYTNYLTPAQFGTLEIFYMSTAVISIFLGTQL
ncbi:MAG TPA: polysaccharide biosynthesis protein, partial [Deltaproteobacteria bacterium]|nr:polysaccharide biosynthesis protein [Deltaproteobacteria bacterium]